MKRILKTVAAVAASVTMLSTAAAFGGITASAAQSGDLTYSISGNTVTITKCKATATNVEIPQTLEGKKVVAISANAFKDCNKLKSVKLPTTLSYIGGSAFKNCSELTEITIPYRVSSLKTYTFSGCTKLKKMTIDNPSLSIEPYAMDPVTSSTDYRYLYFNRRWIDANGSNPGHYTNQNGSTVGGWRVRGFGLGDFINHDSYTVDSYVDICDAQNILNFYCEYVLSGKPLPSNYNAYYLQAAGDVNRDGVISVEDAQIVMRYYTKTQVALTFDGSLAEYLDIYVYE